LPCPCTDGCVLTAINVIKERHSANCCVVIAQTGCIRVIIKERVITNGGVCNAANIEEKREVAKSVVAVSVNVISERIGADSIVVSAKWEAVCEGVIKQERIITHGRVAAGGKITIERSITNGGVGIAISVELERLSANCRVVAGKAGPSRVIVRERKGADSSVVFAAAVEGESANSNGRVVIAAEVEDHRCSANCGIGISSVEGQRSSAKTGVEAGATD